ncbi:acid-sensing ion channel 1-like [Patiria miniata]|uniref:Uncharacterized protein n=1 Tax=Patiria miniata TaxID=46514 RepID=A0A913ZUQ9_PATMI|nr:acid-sensing ion channel 1-like [Patiria miniata]
MDVWTVEKSLKTIDESTSTDSVRMRGWKHEEGDVDGRRRSVHTQTDCDRSNADNCRQIFSQRKWKDFGTVTTLHGMRYITHSNYSLVRRIIWAIVLLFFMGVLIFVVVDNTVRYFNYNVTSIVTVKYVNDLTFPAVTICNYNLLRKSYSEKAFDEDVLDAFKVFGPSNGQSSINFTALKDWNITDDLIKGAHQKEDMVIECSWRSTINCTADNFTQVLTDFGICYTFNDPKNPEDALKVQQTGYDSGLYLRLNLEQYDYFYGFSKGAGFKVMLHKQGEFPFVKQLGFAISPGFETLVTLKFTQLVNKETPYVTHCVVSEDIHGFKYTVETCQALCRTEYILANCGCRTSELPAGPDMGQLRFCTYGEIIQCVQPAMRKWAFFADLDARCNCSVPCFREVFSPRISEVFWPAEHITKALQDAFNSSESFLRKNIIDVVIFFEELNYEEIRQVAAYPFTDLLSDIGGYMGLMVGASLITFLEFVDFLAIGVIEYCQKHNIFKRRRKINISQTHIRS